MSLVTLGTKIQMAYICRDVQWQFGRISNFRDERHI